MLRNGVVIRHVDNSLSEYEGAHYVDRYKQLISQGLDGLALLRELISDDVGAPPRFAEIILDGKKIAVVKGV